MKKILVVDDNIEIRQIMTFIFKQLGYDCISKDSAKSALKDFTFYDLIFIDFSLPKINGLELAKKIKIIDKNSKIILITGFLREYSNDLVTENIEEILFKPFEMDELKEITEKYLKKGTL